MRLCDLGELGLIERVKAGAIVRDYPGLVGIGDDCAVFRMAADRDILLTTDMLVEGVHFLRKKTTARQLGRKSISVNLSDIAACGGVPKEAVISVGVPGDILVEYVEELFAGMRGCAHEYSVNILGGDTVLSPRDLVISVALTGSVGSGRAVLRSGAHAGDVIFLTGPVGEAAAGLDIIKGHNELGQAFSDLVSAQRDPRPPVHEGRTIGRSGLATAMIDVSDGVAIDLGHICDASGLGARIEWDHLPRSTQFGEYAVRTGADERSLTLSGGEDYVLLLTANTVNRERLIKLLKEKCNCALREIGVMTAGSGIELVLPDGKREILPPRGWDHFRRAH